MKKIKGNIVWGKPILFLLLFFIASTLLFWSGRSATYVGYYNDDAAYILLAKALIQNEGYVSIQFPHSPLHRLYPPGFPIFLTPFVAIAGKNYELLKWVTIITTAAGILFCYFLFKSKLPRFFLWSLLIFLSTNTFIMVRSISVMSDLLFLLLSICFFIILSRYETKNPHSLFSLLLGCIVMISATVRVVGFLLIIPIILSGLRLKDAKLIIYGLLPATILLVAASSNGWLEAYSTFPSTPLFLKVNILKENLAYYLSEIIKTILGEHLMELPLNKIRIFLWLLYIPIGIGFILHWKKEEKTWGIYCLIYLITISFFSLRDPRLLLPIIPFLYYFLFKGFTFFLPPNKQLPIFIGVFAVLALFAIRGLLWWFSTMVFPSHLVNTPDTTVFKWINAHTKPTDIVLSGAVERIYLFTERKGLYFHKNQERFHILSFILKNDVKYLYFTPILFTTDYSGTDIAGVNDYAVMVREDTNHFKQVFYNPQCNSYIFEVLPKKTDFFKAMEKINQGAILYEQKRYKEAINTLQKALVLEPDFYLALNLLGVILVDSGKIEDGINILNKSIKLYPSIERGYAALAYAYTKKGDFNKTYELLKNVLELAKRQRHLSIANNIQQELEKLHKKTRKLK